MPANVQKIYQVLVRQKVTPKLQTREQAARAAWRIAKDRRGLRPRWHRRARRSRVAWRIVKDWLEAQLALVAADLADLEHSPRSIRLWIKEASSAQQSEKSEASLERPWRRAGPALGLVACVGPILRGVWGGQSFCLPANVFVLIGFIVPFDSRAGA